MRAGFRTAPELTETLSAPQASTRSEVVQPPDAAPHGEGDENGGGHLGQNIGKELPPLMGRSDVVEHQLVGTGAGVVLRQSHRVGHVPEPLKIDSLYHPSVPYIQAGDDTLGHHVTPPPQGVAQRQGPGVKGLAQNRAVQAQRLQPPQLLQGGHAARGDELQGKPLRQGLVQRHVGPPSIPSRETSVQMTVRTPQSTRRWKKASAGSGAVSRQPWIAMAPSFRSTPTATRSPEAVQCGPEKNGVGDGGSAQDHPRRPRVQVAGHGLQRADAAAHLHL